MPSAYGPDRPGRPAPRRWRDKRQNGKPWACGAGAADDMRAHVIRFVRAHLDDPRLSRAGIAGVHHMSMRTLDRLFADQPWSVSGLIRHERLEAVRRDLADPSLRNRGVAALAARWCFFDAAHFSRVFRRHYGCPPSRTRP